MKRAGALLVAAGAAAAAVGAVAGAERSAERPPPVFLNHVYRVLDHPTFEAAERSEYLRTEFAQFEQRSTKSGGDSWSGLYFYGEHTYFEFLGVTPAAIARSAPAASASESKRSAAVPRCARRSRASAGAPSWNCSARARARGARFRGFE